MKGVLKSVGSFFGIDSETQKKGLQLTEAAQEMVQEGDDAYLEEQTRRRALQHSAQVKSEHEDIQALEQAIR